MKKLGTTALLCGLMAFLATGVALGRGGHGGGGHHGGGHHGGGHHGGAHHHSHTHSHHGVHHHGHTHHGYHHHAHHGYHHDWHHYYHHDGGYAPFTGGWYGAHPGWGWGRVGNPWVAASWAGLGGWLGYEAGTAPLYDVNGPTYGYADNQSDDDGDDSDDNSTDAGETQTASNGSEDNADSKSDDEGKDNVDYAKAAGEASTLADQGAQASVASSDFLPLGVFQISTSEDGTPDALVQLQVSHEGVIRGEYVDLVSHQTQPVTGAVNRETQRVAFRVGPTSKATFDVQLAGLTEEETPAWVHFPGGVTREFYLCRASEKEEQQAEEPTTTTPATEGAQNK
ncbi:MAG: hypothetical protein KF708_22350 [Pirellulales bacterium]|nr:hypothetical protein [Pirellulales bacterium]